VGLVRKLFIKVLLVPAGQGLPRLAHASAG
jgi:hypothetical protein